MWWRGSPRGSSCSLPGITSEGVVKEVFPEVFPLSMPIGAEATTRFGRCGMTALGAWVLGIIVFLGLSMGLAKAESTLELLNGLVSVTVGMEIQQQKVKTTLVNKAQTARSKYLSRSKNNIKACVKQTNGYRTKVVNFRATNKLTVEQATALVAQADRVLAALTQITSQVVRDTGAFLEVTNPASPVYRASVEVPAGAAPTGTVIEIRPEAEPPAMPQNLVAVGNAVQYGPEGAQFSVPVRIGVPYSDNPGMDESQLKMMNFDRVSGDWVEVPVVERDTVNNVLYAEVTHFSLYQVAAPAPVDPDAPFFNFVVVWANNTSSGTGLIMVADVRDPNGSVPETIVSLEVRDADGGLVWRGRKGDYYFDTASKLRHDRGHPEQQYEWYLKTMGVSGLEGEQTFTFNVTDTEGKSATLEKRLLVRPIPIVDKGTIEIKDQTTGQWVSGDRYEGVRVGEDLWFRWRPVDYGGVPVYYRVVIMNWLETRVYRSPRSAAYEVRIPGEELGSILIPNSPFVVRIEAFDSASGFEAMNRSESQPIYFTTQGLSFSGIFLDYALAYVRSDPGLPPYVRAVAAFRRGFGGEPLTPQEVSATVTTPDGQVVPLDGYYVSYLTTNGVWHGEFGNRSDSISGLPKGEYLFKGTGLGGEVWMKDYLNRNHIMPKPTLLYPEDGQEIYTTSPLLTWEDNENCTSFNLMIQRRRPDGSWGPPVATDMLFRPSLQIPPGNLETGGIYRWQVRCWDGRNSAEADSRAFSEYRHFSVSQSAP